MDRPEHPARDHCTALELQWCVFVIFSYERILNMLHIIIFRSQLLVVLHCF